MKGEDRRLKITDYKLKNKDGVKSLDVTESKFQRLAEWQAVSF